MKRVNVLAVLSFCLGLICAEDYVRAGSGFGDGADGPLTISAAGSVVNDYTYLTGNENAGDDVITVADASAFSAGDEIMIIQVQDGAGTGVAGQYEFADIEEVTGNDIVLETALTNDYGSGTFDASASSAAQAIRVPNYTTVNVLSGGSMTCSGWNGRTGGVVVFRAMSSLTFSGDATIDVTGKGYRGGEMNYVHLSIGRQGESYEGTGEKSSSNNNGGGGGGYGISNMEQSGAGGGYGTVGTSQPCGGWCCSLGQPTAVGGEAYGDGFLALLFFGSGGGAGSLDEEGEGAGGSGGAGGGIIYVAAPVVSGGTFSAAGQDGTPALDPPPGSNEAMSGGGGAGGSVYVLSMNQGAAINISGGAGGGYCPGACYTAGDGDGGQGRYLTSQPPTQTPTASPTVSPTYTPTSSHTRSPTQTPTLTLTSSPTRTPTGVPTDSPTFSPTLTQTFSPTSVPTSLPTHTITPTLTVSPNHSTPTNSPSPTQAVIPAAGFPALSLMIFFTTLCIIFGRQR